MSIIVPRNEGEFRKRKEICLELLEKLSMLADVWLLMVKLICSRLELDVNCKH